jgi:hypothetical protein
VLSDGARRGAQAVQDSTPPAVKEKLGQAAAAMNSEFLSRLSIYGADRNVEVAAGFVGDHAQLGGQAAVGTSPSRHRGSRKLPRPLLLAL